MRLGSLTTGIELNALAAAEAVVASSLVVSLHRQNDASQWCQHRRRGLDVVDCCTSEHAGLAFLVDPIKAARGGCSAGDVPCAWRHFAVEALCATMCLLPPSTVYAAIHGCLCGPLLLRREFGPYKRCGSERSAGVATVEREHAWSGLRAVYIWIT